MYRKTQLEKYKIQIKTGSQWWNGTHGRVKIQLIGSKGQTGWRHLRHKVQIKNHLDAISVLLRNETSQNFSRRNWFIDFHQPEKSRGFLSKFRRGNLAKFEIKSADIGKSSSLTLDLR